MGICTQPAESAPSAALMHQARLLHTHAPYVLRIVFCKEKKIVSKNILRYARDPHQALQPPGYEKRSSYGGNGSLCGLEIGPDRFFFNFFFGLILVPLATEIRLPAIKNFNLLPRLLVNVYL